MAGLLSAFVLDRNQRLTGYAVWILGFCVSVVLLAAAAVNASLETLKAAAADNLPELVRLKEASVSTFAVLAETVTAPACSADFHRQLRTVAYIPDGISEFLAVADGRVLCSTSVDRFADPPALGLPSVELPGDGAAYWIDAPLDRIGLAGLTGAILQRGDFAVVLPPMPVRSQQPDWVEVEYVIRRPDGHWWHSGGVEGLYDPVRPTGLAPGLTLRDMVCDPSGMDCVVVVGSLGKRLAGTWPVAAVGVVFSGLIAGWGRRRTLHHLRDHWSFERRFARTLGPDTVVCHYQPILDVRTGVITGCEVLARWRDVDDKIVAPDRFLPVVERLGLTRRFTRLVVEKAHAELSVADLPEGRFRVSVNIFPQDLDAEVLLTALAPLLEDQERFELVVELLETSRINMATAAPAIQALQRAGAKVYIDDFGTGYFSVQMLVDLAVDGVKLDRVFAMAPEGSLLARMMGLAIEMIEATGRPVVVEGVESAERLDELRASSAGVAYAQGYHISRPVDATRLAERCRPDTAAAALAVA